MNAAAVRNMTSPRTSLPEDNCFSACSSLACAASYFFTAAAFAATSTPERFTRPSKYSAAFFSNSARSCPL